MPTYSIQGPDGKTYSIDGPEGATRDQVIAEIKRQQGNDQGPGALQRLLSPHFNETEKEGLKGLGRGVTGILGDIGETLTGKKLREDIADLRATFAGDKESKKTPSYAAGMNKSLGLEPDPDASFGARAAGGVGEALTDPLSWIGPGGPALKAAGAVTGAVGSEAAGSAADALGLPELPARVLGGALAGRATGAVAGAPAAKQGTRALLNSQELHDESRTAYQQLENAPLRVRPDGMLNLHNAVNKALDQDAFDPMTAPLTYHFVDRLIDQRPQQHPAKLRDIVNIHEKLGQISPQRDAKDAAAAGLARSEIRNWLEQNIPQTQPQLRNALGNWSAHKKSEELGTVEDVARHRAGVSGTGSNVQNTMRQEIRKILDNPRRARGYSPAQLAQMEKVVEGTVAENVARWAGRFAPTGLHSTMGLAFISHIMNSSLALVGAGAAYGAKKIGDVFTRQEIEKLATMVLEGAPANRAQAARNAAQRASSLVASRAQAVRSAAPPIEQTPYDVLDNPSGIDFDQTPAR